MADDKNKKPIVVKRIKKVVGMPHGGSWKIAYADFVTAMMAFFLLMWLLGTTNKGDLEGIAEYFKMPLKVALSGGKVSGETTSFIQGGGQDLTRAEGQVKLGGTSAEKKVIDLEKIKQEVLRSQREREAEKLKQLKASIEKAIESNPKLQQFKKQILLDITSEGLRIQIVDEKNRPMFQLGSAQLESYTKEILHEIGKMLNEVPNKVSISGHTDAALYGGGAKGYSNWELSADRANASRRELIVGGMAEEKIIRVVGLSSAVLFNKEDPLNPTNRRISMIVMNKKAEEAASRDGGTVGGDPAENDAESGDASANETPAETPPNNEVAPAVPAAQQP
ncbi:MAG: flagellar motor protein MotB [Gallionellales bacterium RIFCSPLOWO2_12_FULL_59_22]|nr:MAG: flagellar motor protein MotB [Gallionellales bacterium RIFCSPLOWO2_02_FULL_59_110]OGT04057.1 MAG: flagellar motor protein MotB [Gallionellales bacterium RIFCSPLOWO2_02_58_13]OGT11261.1 MAG: flagellar motor protein MotB [Gallionellales bacterium RIFCSPLOWO2_12_FULL_59_22]